MFEFVTTSTTRGHTARILLMSTTFTPFGSSLSNTVNVSNQVSRRNCIRFLDLIIIYWPLGRECNIPPLTVAGPQALSIKTFAPATATAFVRRKLNLFPQNCSMLPIPMCLSDRASDDSLTLVQQESNQNRDFVSIDADGLGMCSNGKRRS
jgi:hypothetical protein